MKIVIVGAGGHGQVVADVFRQAAATSGLAILGYVDDDSTLAAGTFLGLPVLGTIASLARIEHDAIVVAIGENRRRADITARLAGLGERMISAIHPSALIGSEAHIEPGAMLCAGCVVSTGSRIGAGVIVNTAATVDHHSLIGDFAHIAPGVHMGGEVHVGAGTLVGIGATVLPRVRIGRNATIGGGAVVTRNVPDGAVVVGNPARQLTRVP